MVVVVEVLGSEQEIVRGDAVEAPCARQAVEVVEAVVGGLFVRPRRRGSRGYSRTIRSSWRRARSRLSPTLLLQIGDVARLSSGAFFAAAIFSSGGGPSGVCVPCPRGKTMFRQASIRLCASDRSPAGASTVGSRPASISRRLPGLAHLDRPADPRHRHRVAIGVQSVT